MFEMHCVIKKFLAGTSDDATSMNYHLKYVNLPSHFLLKIEKNPTETFHMLKVAFGRANQNFGWSFEVQK